MVASPLYRRDFGLKFFQNQILFSAKVASSVTRHNVGSTWSGNKAVKKLKKTYNLLVLCYVFFVSHALKIHVGMDLYKF